MKWILLACSLFVFNVFSQEPESEIKSRLDKISKERAKIQSNIDSGMDASLFEEALNNFDNEEAELKAKLPKNKPKKKTTSRRRPRRAPIPPQPIYTAPKKVSPRASSVGSVRPPSSRSNEMTFTLTGGGKVRHESKINNDFIDEVDDDREWTVSQFRVNFKGQAKGSSKWHVLFQPQFVKYWGAYDYLPTDSSSDGTETENTQKTTSSQLYDTRTDTHQAYIHIKPWERVVFKIGRQEFIYGDHLVVGNVGWHPIGRSFDAYKATYSHKFGWVDAFHSKVVDNNINAGGDAEGTDGDVDFEGVYSSNDFGKYFKTVEFYHFVKDDHSAEEEEDHVTISTNGIRMKSPIGKFDYRIEYTSQHSNNGQADDFKNEFQSNVELGYKFGWMGSRLSVESFAASKDYNQLYPTAHKFLGFADMFKRKNIKGTVVHASLKPMDNLTFKLDQHTFERYDTDERVDNFGGNAGIGGSTGLENDKSAIASETDATLVYNIDKGLKLILVYAVVTPGAYLKSLEVNGEKLDDQVNYSYFEFNARF